MGKCEISDNRLKGNSSCPNKNKKVMSAGQRVTRLTIMFVIRIKNLVIILTDFPAFGSRGIAITRWTSSIDVVFTGWDLVGSADSFGTIETTTHKTSLLPEFPSHLRKTTIAAHSTIRAAGEQVICAQMNAWIASTSHALIMNAETV